MGAFYQIIQLSFAKYSPEMIKFMGDGVWLFGRGLSKTINMRFPPFKPPIPAPSDKSSLHLRNAKSSRVGNLDRLRIQTAL